MKYPGSPTHQIVLRALDEHYREDDRVLSFIVFGSVGRGDWHPLSDLDLDVIVADHVDVKPDEEADQLGEVLTRINEEMLLVVPDGNDAIDIVLSSLMGLSIRFHHLNTTKPAILDSMLVLSGSIDAGTIQSEAVCRSTSRESSSIVLDRCIRYLVETSHEIQRERLWSALEGLHRARSLIMVLFAQHHGEPRSLRGFQDRAEPGLQSQLARTVPEATFSSVLTGIVGLLDFIESQLDNPENGWLVATENQRRLLALVRTRVTGTGSDHRF